MNEQPIITTGLERLSNEILGISSVYLYNIDHLDNLPEVAKKELLEKSIPLISQSFGQRQGDPNFKEDVEKFLRNGELYIITHKDAEVIGIRLVQAWVFKNLRILYLAGSAISPNWQRAGLNLRLTSWIASSRNVDITVARTQNPNIYSMMQKFCSKVWPKLEESTPENIQEIGLEMAQRLSRTTDKFNPNILVEIETYGSSLYDTIPHPQNRDQNINNLFSTLLDFGRGDSIFVIGETSK